MVFTTFFSCKRKVDTFTTDPSAKLSFSRSEISFDTIFTSIGSVTQRLWVYNDNSHAVKISAIHLAKLYNSSFKLTIDGEERVELSNYELKGKDSLQILVKVLINPQNQSLAYLVEDSIVFETNGNIQDVDLVAFGQDAVFLTNTTLPCNTSWTNIKPYVITGNIKVAAGCTLTIDQGTRVRFHKNASMTVNGTLLVLGNKDSIVTFAHDNLSRFYDDLPGQWGGLVFKAGSKNNSIVFAEIKNATNAITLYPENDGDTIAEVKIENSIVKNCSKNGITAVGSDFYALNSLVSNCAGYLVNASSGGNYYFDFCTLTNYSYDFFREAPGVRFSNNDFTGNGDLKAQFRNTILWGDKNDELVFNNSVGNAFSFEADYSILRTSLSIVGTSNLINQNPLFENEYSKKFYLLPASPAINSGNLYPIISTDLVGKTRDASPDRGCYEK